MKKWFIALVVGGLVLGMVPAVGAVSDEEFFKLAGKRNWLSFADARPVSPFFGIPGELRPGAPFARSYLDASPGRSECFASLYYPDEVVEEGVLQTTGHYENRTMARTNNPDVGAGTKKEVAPFGMAGPHAVTENPTRTECFSEAASAVTPAPEAMVDGGFARTHAVFDGDKVLTDEAISRVAGVTAGPIKIAFMETQLKLEYILDAEPVITYKVTIAGVSNGAESVVGFGDKGITLAGEKVAGREFVDQFNSEVAKAGATFKEQAWADYIQIVSPVVQKDDDGGVHVTGPALEIGQVNTSRQGQGGSHFGVRLGYASVYALLNGLEGLAPDAGGIPSDLTGDAPPGTSPLEGQFGDEASADAAGLSAAPSPTTADASALGVSTGAGTGSSGLGSGGYGGASTDTGAADASAAAATDTAAPAAAEEALPLLGGGTPQLGASAQLAAAESRRAAKNTANGLLGGILLLLGSMVWAVGMAVFGKK